MGKEGGDEKDTQVEREWDWCLFHMMEVKGFVRVMGRGPRARRGYPGVIWKPGCVVVDV